MTEFYHHCEEVSFSVLAALEEALELPPRTFESLCKPCNASEARLNRYPATPLEEMRSGDTNRISPHFDLGVVTLLFSDSIGGLEFQDRRNMGHGAERFEPVQSAGPTEMIVSIAETMQRWTQDKVPASLHQVTVPSTMRDQEKGIVPERHSIVYLCKADRNASVGVLPEFRDGVDVKYEHMTALEYHQRRIAAAY